jgi:hypothetical protein
MTHQVKPQHGRYAVAMPNGHVWLETIRYRAREARAAMGEIFIGWQEKGRKVQTAEEGWARALKRGYRVVRVDVLPAQEEK